MTEKTEYCIQGKFRESFGDWWDETFHYDFYIAGLMLEAFKKTRPDLD